jgi:integrase
MRKLHLLTELQVRNAKPAKGKFVDRIPDGGNLYLQVTRSLSEGFNRNWVFRFEMDGKRHDLGLGPAHTVGLKAARAKAAELRMQIYEGIDPAQEKAELKAERKAKRAAEIKRMTFAECWQAYYKVHAKDWKHPKHRQQWESSMRTYVLPVIGSLNVADIETAHVEKVLSPIWDKIPESASRIQNRLSMVLNFAIAGGYRGKDNPAARALVKARLGKVKRGNGHYQAMLYVDAPAFMAELRGRDLVSARALEFAILTATRTNETLGATWDEIDLTHRLWTIPEARMKADRDHRVPLSDRAVDILKSLHHSGKRQQHVFLNEAKKPFNEGALLKVLQGMVPDATVHGFRSTFRDWAAERTNYPRDLAELCLAHKIGDATEQAYRRGDGLQKRIRLMQTWADFLATPQPAKTGDVADLAAERKRRAS